MKVVQISVKGFLLYIAAVIGASVLGISGYTFCLFTDLYRLASVTTIICFLCLPIGSALGMYLLDRWIYEPPRHLIWRILVASLIGVGGFKLITICVTQSQKDILLSPLPSELFLHPVIVAFFSLIGYLFVGLFEKGRSKGQSSENIGNVADEDEDILLTRREKQKMLVIAIIFFGTLTLLTAIGYCIIFLPLSLSQEVEAAGATNFFKQFLVSINNDTDFYKIHTDELPRTAIQKYRPMFSSNYTFSLEKSVKGWYEYYVIYNEKNVFKVGIDASNRSFVVRDFTYNNDAVTTKQTWALQGISNEEATTFFKQILSSINNETNFYKEHSKEPAIQQIKKCRPMISSDYVLVDRSRENTNGFYFYVTFNLKHDFQMYIKYSKNGFTLRSFTYLGEFDKGGMRVADFLRQILSSINEETSFYKKFSEESAIQEIQNKRSSISSSDVLARMSQEGNLDFYFYVVFDEENIFKVHIENAKKGFFAKKSFLLKGFTYIGKNDGRWSFGDEKDIHSR